MDDYAVYGGRLLAERYRLPPAPAEEPELAESIAYDTASGQEVLVYQVPLPEVVDAEVVDGDRGSGGGAAPGHDAPGSFDLSAGRATRRPADPAVRRAVDAALAAADLPDHPRLVQVFDVFVEGGGLWVVTELVPARPLVALLSEAPLGAHRAAEIAADLLAALTTVHTYGWIHRNITTRTVLICDDGRAVLTGLAVGAAQEALCGYDALPGAGDSAGAGTPPAPCTLPGPDMATGPDAAPRPDAAPGSGPGAQGRDPLPATRSGQALPEGFDARGGSGAVEAPESFPGRGEHPDGQQAFGDGGFEDQEDGETRSSGVGPVPSSGAEARAARRGAIAAYRAGTQRAAAARTQSPVPPQGPRTPGGDEAGPTALPGARPGRSRPVPMTWVPEPTVAPEPGSEPAAEQQAEPERPEPGLVATPGQSEPVAGADGDRYRGPTTVLAAERARQARMTVVGAVTERWAPEQAGPVHGNWRLAPPVGPAADLWALGVLLFRAVQGHAPYPEESAAELVQMVCAETPAFAEDCGPLRPVVESLMRQDPTQRTEFEELRGWLRSLVRSAPEPEVGRRTVLGPPSLGPGEPSDPRRLPILRRRGELVRRRRKRPAAQERPRGEEFPRQRVPAQPSGREHEGREHEGRGRPVEPGGEAYGPLQVVREQRGSQGRRKRGQERERKPWKLGSWLLAAVLAGLGAVVLYAMVFMPGDNTAADAGGQRRGEVGAQSRVPGNGDGSAEGGDAPGTAGPQTTAPADQVPDGYKLSRDPAGFVIAVPEKWDRRSTTDSGQVRYNGGQVEMVVVKGRDAVKKYGKDPKVYQSDDEPELKAYRDSDWASASGLRRIDVGSAAMAEGTFSWQDNGRDVYARNRAMVLDGRYHVLLVMGSESKKKEIDRHFEAVADTYRVTDS